MTEIRLSGGLVAALEAGAPKALELPAAVLAGIAVTTAGVVIAVMVLRMALGRRLLNNRVTYDLLPTNSFDPSPEDIVRFANQLTRVRPAASRFAPRHAAVVRIQLSTGEDGLLAYSLTGPAIAASVLGQQGYGQVELKRRADPQTPTAESDASAGPATTADPMAAAASPSAPVAAGDQTLRDDA